MELSARAERLERCGRSTKGKGAFNLKGRGFSTGHVLRRQITNKSNNKTTTRYMDYAQVCASASKAHGPWRIVDVNDRLESGGFVGYSHTL